MGQYYKGIILNSSNQYASNKKKIAAFVAPRDYNCGCKLTEHFYNSGAVGAFEALINKEYGKFAGLPVVWSGDYADDEPRNFNKQKTNLFYLADEFPTKRQCGIIPYHYRYIINEESKEFFDTENCVSHNWCGETINILPLLIADGNGRGSGDFRGKNQHTVGIWARQIVVVSNNRPDKSYREVELIFDEKY